MTTRGFNEEDCEKVADLITEIIRSKESAFDAVRKGVKELIEKRPLYKNTFDF